MPCLALNSAPQRGEVAKHVLLATCGSQPDVRSPVADDDRREVPRFVENGTSRRDPRFSRAGLCPARPAGGDYEGSTQHPRDTCIRGIAILTANLVDALEVVPKER